MRSTSSDHVKHRIIAFRGPHPDPHQAQSAVLLLADLEGMQRVLLPHPAAELLHISYDIRFICLRVIEEFLIEMGYHLDNGLVYKLKRALYHYTEQVEQDSVGCKNCTRRIFVETYRRRMHGCRDERPDHWRKYL
jgi:hypothetical protein